MRKPWRHIDQPTESNAAATQLKQSADMKDYHAKEM
jgi:hypothetical protein